MELALAVIRVPCRLLGMLFTVTYQDIRSITEVRKDRP